MSVFAYIALAKDGRRTSGTLAADSRAAAIVLMGRQGLHPVQIAEAKDAAAVAKVTQAKSEKLAIGKVSVKSVEAFTRELANLLAGGVPLSRALSLLRREASNPSAKKLWTAIHDDVVGGTSLAESMAKFPRNFSSVYVAMIRAGETGGFLDVVLAQMADFRARESDLKGKVTMAMVYPAILALLAVAVMVLMLTFFIPRFSGIFAMYGNNLPAITVFVIAASNLIKNYGLFVLGGIGLAIFILRRVISTDSGRRKFELALLSVPLLGQIIAQFALVRFGRMLGTLVGAGVPLIASLRVAREAIGNQVLADTVTHAIEQVQRGTALSKSLASNSKLFPPSVIEMLAVAEETGRLDKELLRLASAYELGLDRQLRILVSIVEPMMLFLMAGIIGTIVVGMLLPVLNLQDLVH